MQHIVIIGSGFAALTAIKTIRQKDSNCKITVISPKAEFLYAPSLIWIPTGLRKGEELVINLEHFFKRMCVTHHAGHVTGVSNGGRTIMTSNGSVVNDALIIASGGQFLKKISGIENVLTICEGLKPALEIRQKLLSMNSGTIAFGFAGNPNEPQALRGGPMFELLLGIDTWLRTQGKRDQFTLKFFCPAPKPGIRLGERAFEGIMREMHKRNIEISCLGSKIKKFEPTKIVTETAEISADMILFMPGLTGPSWLSNTNFPLSAGGMISCDNYTRVKNFEKVYAVGDSASYEAPDWAPKQAHMADLQAKAAAKNALDELNGKTATKTFRWELICIIDTLDKGILVFRNQTRKLVLPSKIFHFAKRIFERKYIGQYSK